MNPMYMRIAVLVAVRDGNEAPTDEHVSFAKTILEAMREPTEEMLNSSNFRDDDGVGRHAFEVWPDMIDAALGHYWWQQPEPTG